MASQKYLGQNMAFKLSSKLVDTTKGNGNIICEKEDHLIKWQRKIELSHICVNP